MLALAFTLAALVFSDMLQVWHIVVVSALSGIVQALMVPASTSILPSLVGEKDTANAIAPEFASVQRFACHRSGDWRRDVDLSGSFVQLRPKWA